MTLPNFDWLRSVPVIGPRLYEIFNAVQQQGAAIAAQTATNPTGQPSPPPTISGLKVTTGPGGEFQAAITDNSNVSRSVKYFLEHADNPSFQNPHHIDLGSSRNWSGYMGAQTLYWRAYSSYPGSQSGAPQYHGSAARPLPVTGGVIGKRAASQGAGTGAPGQGLYGPGPVPQRGPSSGFDSGAQA